MNWLAITPTLDAAQLLSFVGNGFDSYALLTAFNATQDAKYLLHWAAMIDDWLLNFFTDADHANRAGVNVKNIFVHPEGEWIRTSLTGFSDRYPNQQSSGNHSSRD